MEPSSGTTRSLDTVASDPPSQVTELPDDAVLELPPHLREIKLKPRDDVHTGRLKNGFEYVVLRNDAEKQDFLAHLEVRVGSADEEDDEQGIAHFLEHAVFGGTSTYPSADVIRTVLSRWGMSFGGDTNAYTDFRRTVYTFQAPASPDIQDTNTKDVISILHELMFRALIDERYVDTERKAVLSEQQMRNTVEYRSEVESYAQMHSGDRLSGRFPIGLVEQIARFTAQDLKRFYSKHYTPDRMTLYLVGCIDPSVAIDAITASFGSEGGSSVETSSGRGISSTRLNTGPGDLGPLLSHPHRYRPIGTSLQRPPRRVAIYQHDLIHQVTFTLKVLEPTLAVTSLSEMAINLIDSIISQALDTRVNARYLASANPPFTGWDWMFTDSHRDDCALNALSISCEADSWERGIHAGLQAAHQMAQYGMSPAEFKYSLAAVVRASAEEAAQRETIPHSTVLENIMEDISLGCSILDPLQTHEALLAVVDEVSLQQVNMRAAEVLSFVRHFPRSSCRSFVFMTAPSSLQVSEEKILSLIQTALDNSTPPADVLVPSELLSSDVMATKMGRTRAHFVNVFQDEGLDSASSSSGTMSFLNSTTGATDSPSSIDHDETIDLDTSISVEPHNHDDADADADDDDARPGEGNPTVVSSIPVRLYDPQTEICRRRLSNGVCVSYKECSFDAQSCTIRIAATGGRAREPSRYPTGSVPVGLGTLLDSSAGGHSSDVLSRYCALHAIDVDYKIEAERTIITIQFGVSQDDALACAFSLLHLYLNESRLDEEAFERTVRECQLAYEEGQLDSVTVSSNATALALVPGDVRFHPLTTLALKGLTRQHCARALAHELRPCNLDVTIVGEFGDAVTLEHYVLHFLGTLTQRSPDDYLKGIGGDLTPAKMSTPSSKRGSESIGPDQGGVTYTPRVVKGPHIVPSEMECFDVLPMQNSVFIHRHVREEHARAVAYIAWPVCNAWGRSQGWHGPGNIDWAQVMGSKATARTSDPMFTQRLNFVVREVVNNRLYRELRERYGHTYTASYSPALLYYYRVGFNYISMQMFPGQIKEAVKALYNVIESLRTGITQEEVDEAVIPLVATAKTGLRTTGVWLALMSDLHAHNVIPKDITCLHNIVEFYQGVQLAEVQAVAHKVLDLSVHVLSIGTSGDQEYRVTARRQGHTFEVSEHPATSTRCTIS